MKIEDGKRVRLKTMLKVVDGDVIEQSVVEYFQGGGTMLPGLERELAGLGEGDTKSGVIDAEHAFGDPSMQPKKTLGKAEFPEDAELEKGARFEAKGANGQDVVLQVEDVRDDEIDVRFVHPLADKNIEFEVEVISVTDPSPPPLPADAVTAESED